MAANRVFISYKHEDPWVAMAEKFRIKLDNYGDEWDLEYFIDEAQIDVGDTWRGNIDAALADCTHFLVLLCDTYWESAECRRELDAVLERRAAGQTVRLMFVLAEPMKPALLRFNAKGEPVGDVSRVGDFHFLGPYNEVRQLVALTKIEKGQWGEAIEKMLSSAKIKRMARQAG
jgi:hypothetical protein